MATLPNSSARSSGGQSLNLAMAGLAAVALAFFTYAMPDGLFSSLVSRSGLPGLVAAAEPPLGMKARAAVIAAVAILIFAAVLLLFRAIDRISARPAKALAGTDEAEAPRLRRADAHPDAPARRPLLAGRDLGDYVEPEEEDEDFDLPPVEEKFADIEVSPLPGFLAAEAVEAPEAEFEDAPVSFAQPSEERDIDALVSQLPDLGEVGGHESISELMQRLESGLSQRELSAEPVQAEPAPAERQRMPQWLNASEPVELNEVASAPEAAEFEQVQAEEPETIDFAALRSSGRRISEFGEIEAEEPEAADVAASHSTELNLSGFAEIEPEAEADEEVESEEEESEDEAEEESPGLGYASLRTRTPLDLSQPFPQAPEPQAEEVEAPVEPQVGHRLRGTIKDLRRIAGRG